MARSADRSDLEVVGMALGDVLGNFGDHFFEEKAEVRTWSIVSGSNMADAIGLSGELVALFETGV